MSELRFVVPLIPPSVNHYKVRTRKGVTFVTKEAKAFKVAVAVFAEGRKVVAKQYRLAVVVYLGKGQRGDGDNFFKCIGDGIKEAGVIHSDAAIKDWSIKVERDRIHPRTDITITAI